MTAAVVDRHSKAVRLAHETGSAAAFARSTFEALVLLLVLMAVEQLFFGPQYYAQLAAHPFWIVILVASVQNGLFAGVAATVLAGLMMDWPPRPIGADITEHYLSIAILPLQWLVVAIVIGVFRQGQIRTERRLAADNRRLAGMNDALAAEIVRLDGIVAELELAAVTVRGETSDGPVRQLAGGNRG